MERTTGDSNGTPWTSEAWSEKQLRIAVEALKLAQKHHDIALAYTAQASRYAHLARLWAYGSFGLLVLQVLLGGLRIIFPRF